MKLKESIIKYWQEKPLLLILFCSAFFRLLAVIFSKGYGMSDDHFLIIEAAQSWVDGADYNYWIPTISRNVATPTGHPLFYSGLHYLLFRLLQGMGVYDPQIKMYIVRFIHAVYSLSIVYFGFKITERLAGIKPAKTVGMLLGLLWFMPMMSVRNLVEFVCIPPLMYATWLVIKNEGKQKWMPYFWVGFLLGLAFNIRFQTITFIGGFGLAILILRKWKEGILIFFGFIICIGIIQSCTDMIIWKKPFMELTEYVRYNFANSETYGTQPWYNYLILLSGIIIPPIGLFILFGFIYGIKLNWRKHLILFLPAFFFFVAHSYFPNKQEQFILPAIPFITILGYIGWYQFKSNSSFWQRNTKLLRGFWIFFWVINLIPLCFISTAYSKRSRVESMVYIAKQKDAKFILIEESQHEDFTLPPLFYLQKWGYVYNVTGHQPIDSLRKLLASNDISQHPNYIVFNEDNNIDKRVADMKTIFTKMTYMTTIEPGLIDKVLYFLNPKHNANYTCFIYKTNE